MPKKTVTLKSGVDAHAPSAFQQAREMWKEGKSGAAMDLMSPWLDGVQHESIIGIISGRIRATVDENDVTWKEES